MRRIVPRRAPLPVPQHEEPAPAPAPEAAPRKRRIVNQRAPMPRHQGSLPPGVTPGVMLEGGPMIYLSEGPVPGVVLLYRWYIPEGFTNNARAGAPASELVHGDGDSHASKPLFRNGYRLYHNPFAGQWGWTLNAVGKKAAAELGLTGPDDAARLRHWFVQLPAEGRVTLQRADLLPPGDPLRASGMNFRQWVSDECITGLMRAAAAGSPQVAPILFAVPPKQTVRLGGGQTTIIHPIQEIVRVFQRAKDNPEACALQPSGMSLADAARVLGLRSRHDFGLAPEKLYEIWRARAAATSGRAQLELNTAYHRILLHKFLRQRRLTPNVARSSVIGRAIERRANLLQAYRVFVFDRRGCPVGLNVPLLEANGLDVKALLEKKVHHAGFTASDARTRKFGEWLFTDVLDKALVECKPSSIHGLSELLAAVDRFG